jgi:hypothetical protein
MAWPGDAGGTPAQSASTGFDPLGLLFGAGPQLWPLRERLQAAVATAERYMNDPEVKKIIAESPEVAAFVKKAMADPAIKDAVAVILQAMTIVAKVK